MAEPVKIPVKIQYDGSGFKQLTRDAQQAERAAMAATRQQIQARRNLQRLSAGLDRSLAGERPSFESRVGGAVRNQLIGAVSVAALAEMARQTTQTAAEMVALDSQADATRQTFVNLSGGAEQAVDNMAALDRATRGLISDQQQQAIANQLLGMQLVSNADELETVIEGSRRLGKEFRGMNAQEAAQDFAALLANMSYLRLDQFGLSSAKVRQRVNELKDAGMGAEEAFRTAVFEEMEKTLARLGPETETTADKMNRLNAEWTNLKTTAGDTLTTLGDTSGILDGLASSLDGVNQALKGFNDASKALDIVEEKARDKLDPSLHKTIDTLDTLKAVTNPLAFVFEKVATYLGTAAFNADGLAEAYDELETATTGATDATNDNTAALEANEEELKRLEKAREIQRDSVAELLAIEEQYAADSTATWDDWRNDVSALNSDTWKRLEKIGQDGAKRQKQIQSDLAKDLAAVDKDLARDLARARADTEKRDRRAAEDAARQETRARQRQRIDALADERLFQFELRQMAAEGDAIGIQQALERRAIEEQIAAERSQAEQQIEAEDAQIAQQRQREDDAERIRDIRDAAAERKAEIEQAALEAAEAERVRIREVVDAENEAYSERLAALEQSRTDKLVELENGRADAIQVLGEELAQVKDLTTGELAALESAAGQIGRDVGVAFSYGLSEGARQSRFIDALLGFGGGGDLPGGAGSSTSTSNTTMQRDIPGFANGGTVPGPLGAPMLAVVHGGENITRPGQGAGVTVNISGVGVDLLAQIVNGKMNEALEEYDRQLAAVLN